MPKTKRHKHQLFREEKRRRKKRQKLILIGIGLVALIAIAGFAIQGVQQSRLKHTVGEWIASQGNEHVAEGEHHEEYSTDPPTSGPHGDAVKAGFYEDPIPDENIVHNLEHGHVAISYDCAQLEDCDEVQANLRRLVKKYDSWKVIAVPRENRDAPLALTAWQRLELLDEYDEATIIAFIDAWRDQGPEKTVE